MWGLESVTARKEWGLESVTAVVYALLLGATGYFALHFLGCLYLAWAVGSHLGVVVVAVLMRKSFALLVTVATALIFHAQTRPRYPLLACMVGATCLLATTHFHARSPWLTYWKVDSLLPLFFTQGSALALLPLLRRVPGPPAVAGTVHFVVPVALTLIILSLVPSTWGLQMNHLGLISGRPGSSFTRDFSNKTNKDGYPPCTFSYNSLGYRDLDPPPVAEGHHRILVIGDSFVWGDGIPSNEETLTYRLRADLETRAPGRFDVMSAAFPGLGVYGYSRLVNVLQPLLKADTVVVGFLGEPDFDPFDPQCILDGLPESHLARNLIVNLDVAQLIHETSVTSYDSIWNSPAARAWAAQIIKSFGIKATKNGYRVFVFNYMIGPSEYDFGSARVLTCPSKLAYPGHRTELWYEKDFHPKSALNRILAGYLADALFKTTD